ncbi:MAG: hypothetical protein XD79_0041 [Atribacteria bacterium 34_128]|jgi:hypothetical protein|nr:MAG: hypothetical protein XD79_0041 [Atribacteria bacterium 34_128]
MNKPTYKGKKIAACIGCAVLGLNPALISFPCAIWFIAAPV